MVDPLFVNPICHDQRDPAVMLLPINGLCDSALSRERNIRATIAKKKHQKRALFEYTAYAIPTHLIITV